MLPVDAFGDFQGVVGSLEKIREHIGEPAPPVVVTHYDPVNYSEPLVVRYEH